MAAIMTPGSLPVKGFLDSAVSDAIVAIMKTAKRSPIAQAILTARTKRGLSQFELDTSAGFALGTTAQYECGARIPTLHSAKCLAKALGIDSAVLVELA